MKKYKLRSDLTKQVEGKTLYRVEALRDFGKVKKGDFGGYIEKEENLSHKGDCWVHDAAMVFDNASVTDNAIVTNDSRIYDNAAIFGYALVGGNSKVFGNATVSDNVWLRGDSSVSGNADISGFTILNRDDEITEENQAFHILGFKRPITVTNKYAHIGIRSIPVDKLDEKTKDANFSDESFVTAKEMIKLALKTLAKG